MSRCITRDEPATIPGCEELIRQHQELKEGFGEAYGSIRRDGHKLIELLRKPIGERSLPVNFLIGSRHIKETLETLYDENNLVEEEWQKKYTHLKKNLNFQKYKEEEKKVVCVYVCVCVCVMCVCACVSCVCMCVMCVFCVHECAYVHM